MLEGASQYSPKPKYWFVNGFGQLEQVMTLCEIMNKLDGNVSVEAGVHLQIGLKRMFSVAKEVVKVFVNSNVAAGDQPNVLSA